MSSGENTLFARPVVEHTVVDGRSTPRRSRRMSALDMERGEDYRLYIPNAGGGPASDNVITEIDGVDPEKEMEAKLERMQPKRPEPQAKPQDAKVPDDPNGHSLAEQGSALRSNREAKRELRTAEKPLPVETKKIE